MHLVADVRSLTRSKLPHWDDLARPQELIKLEVQQIRTLCSLFGFGYRAQHERSMAARLPRAPAGLALWLADVRFAERDNVSTRVLLGVLRDNEHDGSTLLNDLELHGRSSAIVERVRHSVVAILTRSIGP
jgi:hypothetical protein